MAILITSSGLVTTGTEGADDIRFITGGLTGNGSVVNGLAGNDTIFGTDLTVVSAASIGSGPSINGGGGADSINIDFSGSTTSATNTQIFGGAGRDTITLSGEANAGVAKVAGGDGGDLITLQGTGTYSAIGAGAGTDTIELSGATTLVTGASIGLGAGNDVISGTVATLTGAGILGGGGSDTITLTTLANSGSFVNGDSSGNGGAADSIVVTTMEEATIVRGKGGADTITIQNIQGSAAIAGNAGRDVLVVSGTFADDAAIRGGQGGDSIKIDEANLTDTTGELIGGGGKDTITFADTVVNNASITVEGGAGVDSITFSGAINNASDLGAVRINAMGDSTLAGVDTYDVSGLAVGQNATLDVVANSAIGFNSAAAIAAIADINTGVFTTGAAVTGSVTGGYMTFAGEGSATLAAAAGYADAATRIVDGNSQGRSVLFTNNGDDYLFVQGGTAGTSDDFLMELNGASGSTMANSTITLQGDA